MKYLTANPAGFITNTGFVPTIQMAILQVVPGDSLFVASDEVGEINNMFMKVEGNEIIWTEPDKEGEVFCSIEPIDLEEANG